MAGLSRSKNLSENNLNLKTGLQKLYEPGIERDIELFSLSSKITSTVIGGKEVLSAGDPLSQIYGIESQKIRINRLGETQVLDRTKFITRYFTFTNDNFVYFSKLNLLSGSGSINFPIYSNNGSVPALSLIYGGRGFYFQTTSGDPFTTSATEITLNAVKFIGEESGASTLEGSVTFVKDTVTPEELPEIYKFTPGYENRYKIKSITITSRGSNYIIPERVKIVEDANYQISDNSGIVILKKQRGNAFISTNPIIRTALYYYRVVNADASGFYLYDDKENEYIYLNRNTQSLTNNDIEIKRDDSIKINNLLQFKFAGSPIYLRGYNDAYVIGDSISGELANLGGSVQGLIDSVRTGVQNTKKPTPVTSEENTLGYRYNEFVGRDLLIWQRVVIRDQDYLLDPGAPGSRTGLTGDKLRDEVENFEITLGGVKKKIPGLFIRIGDKYFRAFSTSDKPFFQTIGSSIANPNLSNNRQKSDVGALSAEGYFGLNWYSYNTQIAQLAQRIHSNGKDGAFYYHRTTAPSVRAIPIRKGGVNSSIYAVPLFKAS